MPARAFLVSPFAVGIGIVIGVLGSLNALAGILGFSI
jgi:hypothetical protein